MQIHWLKKKKFKSKFIDFENTKFKFLTDFAKVDFKSIFLLIGLM